MSFEEGVSEVSEMSQLTQRGLVAATTMKQRKRHT
jgi:hypothetical protein